MADPFVHTDACPVKGVIAGACAAPACPVCRGPRGAAAAPFPAAAPAAGGDRGMLAGVKVVELATVIAGPLTSALLADMGADVIKVEEPAGDMFRKGGVNPATGVDWRGAPFGTSFEHCNRGKRSVVLDLKDPVGRAAMRALLGAADVFVTNMRAPALRGLGLDSATLRGELPRLIYAHLTAWGLGGPRADDPGYDVGAFWAASGLMRAAKADDTFAGAAPRFPGGLGDQTTSIHLLAGILGALYHRQRTGRGQQVEACLYRAGIWTLGMPALHALATQARDPAKRMGASTRDDFGNPTYNVYKCKDGEWLQMLGLETARHLGKLLDALGLTETVSADPRFGPPGPKMVAKLRGETQRAFTQLLDARFLTRPSAEWEAAFQRAGVWHCRMADINDVVREDHVNRIGAFAPAEGALAGVKHALPNVPIKWSDAPSRPRGRAPALGADTDAVLAALRPLRPRL